MLTRGMGGRIVPPQTPALIEPLVIAYVEQEFAKLNSKNKLTIENLHGGEPWVADYKHWNYEAASRATEARPFSHYTILRMVRG